MKVLSLGLFLKKAVWNSAVRREEDYQKDKDDLRRSCQLIEKVSHEPGTTLSLWGTFKWLESILKSNTELVYLTVEILPFV